MDFETITITFTKKDDPTADNVFQSLEASELRFIKKEVSSRHFYKAMDFDFSLIEIGLLVSWTNRQEIASALSWLKAKGAEVFGKEVCVEIPTADGMMKIRARTFDEANVLISAAVDGKNKMDEHRSASKGKSKPRKKTD